MITKEEQANEYAGYTEGIKAGGNAVVPQIIYQIFKTIQKIEESEHEIN